MAEWKRQYESGEEPSAYKLKKQLNAVKRQEFPWMYDVTKCAVDTGFRNMDAAFKNFFRRCKSGDAKKGYPRFKSKRRSWKSFRMDGGRVKIDGHWYAAVNVEVELPKHEHPQKSVGIDLGINTLAVLSDVWEFENQKLLRSELRKLKRLNRELSRRQEVSSRWNHTKAKLAGFHRRIADQRMDYHQKMTTEIASRYQIIGIEDLNVAGMLRNHRLALSIADAGLGEIRRQLPDKAKWYSSELVEIDRFFPSSRLCRFCGCINDDLTLADRV